MDTNDQEDDKYLEERDIDEDDYDELYDLKIQVRNLNDRVSKLERIIFEQDED